MMVKSRAFLSGDALYIISVEVADIAFVEERETIPVEKICQSNFKFHQCSARLNFKPSHELSSSMCAALLRMHLALHVT